MYMTLAILWCNMLCYAVLLTLYCTTSYKAKSCVNCILSYILSYHISAHQIKLSITLSFVLMHDTMDIVLVYYDILQYLMYIKQHCVCHFALHDMVL